MHQHYMSRARGKEGQAIDGHCQGHEYQYAITLSPLRHLDSAPNFALSTMPLQMTLCPFTLQPRHLFPLYILTDCWKLGHFLLSPYRGVSPWTKHVCGVWIWRYPAPTWWFMLVNWWKHAWHGKYCRSMKNHSHRNRLIMMVGFRSAPQTQISWRHLSCMAWITPTSLRNQFLLWEVHTTFFGIIALPPQPTQLFERSQVIIPTKRRDYQITARNIIRNRSSRWPEEKFLGYDQLKPLRYIA